MDTLPIFDVIIRLGAAFIAGAIIGWERESRGRPAGFRTTILACTAAAVSMIISDALYEQSGGNSATGWRPDPARLGAGILTGIGFLGAGTIIRHENFVRGVTTAASLWFVTVIGLAFGSGLFVVGWVGMAVAAITLFALPLVERHISSDWYATITIVISSGPTDPEVLELLREHELKPTKLKVQSETSTRERTLQVEVKCKRPQRFTVSSEVVNALSTKPGVLRVSWE